jgi:hypothetical protein
VPLRAWEDDPVMQNSGFDHEHARLSVQSRSARPAAAARRVRQVRLARTASSLRRLAAQTVVYSGGMLVLLLVATRLMGE